MIEAELPDGTVLEFPAGTPQAVIQKVVRQRIGVAEAPTKPADSSFGTLGNIAAGAVRGAGSIGATLLSPIDAAARAMGVENEYIGRRDRREAMTEGLRSMGADPESASFQVGKIGAEVAGTAGIPGVLSKAAQSVGAAPAIVNALRTGGLTKDVGMATRIGAGATSGATAAGLVNPEEATTGALVGGAVPMIAPAMRGAGVLARKAIGSTTGVGDEALRQAYLSGKEGGQAAQSFTQHLRGGGQMDDVLASAKQNLQAMGQQRQQAYRAGMANVKADKSVLSFNGIDNAVKNAHGMATFKGQAKNPQAASAVQAVSDEIAQWKALDPADFHTPEGLDALKQRVGAVLESIPFEQRSARTAVGGIYDAIKTEVSKQAPEYSRVMRDYSEATDLIREIEKSLSLGQKSTADTAMRKLQSLMRNNVNTSYGYRDELARQLQQAGGQNIMPALAGQSLSEAMPRGIQRAATGTGGAGLALTGNIPAAVGLGVISSPRLMGESFYGAGKVAGMANPLIEALRRSGTTALPVIAAQ